MKRYLIIGNGVAGTTAAEQIRHHDSEGQVVILTDEDLPFYYRISLHEYIAGERDEQKLIAKKQEWYGDNRIELRMKTAVSQIIADEQVVVTGSGARLSYDRLLIATGASSFIPPVIGVDKEGVFTLRTMADARRILAYAETCSRVVLIGGGLLGLETGNALRRLGKEISVVEFFPRLLPRQLDEAGATRLRLLMEDMGFSFALGAVTREIVGKHAAEGVVLESGRTIPADMVIVSAGVRPNLLLAQEAGLTCDRGIVVNSQLRTSRPEIFAAGDVAQFEEMVYGIWPAALQQGRIAGSNMAGGNEVYRGSTLANKLKVAGLDLAAAGMIDAENNHAAWVQKGGGVYRKFVFDQQPPSCDKVSEFERLRVTPLIGCIMLGDTSGFAAATRAIAEKKGRTELENLLGAAQPVESGQKTG